MDTTSILFRLGLALAVGLLVGTERHWRERDAAPGARTAGIRTFGIAGLLGGLAAALAASLPDSGPGEALLIGFVFLGYSAAFGLFKWREAEEHHEFSVTTVLVGQATFALGALAVLGDMAATAAAAIVLVLLLSSRELLHAFIARLEWAELRSTILLLAMTFVVLPLLPNRSVGPFDAINPAEIWVFAISLAAVSYAGYVSVRIFGSTRGPLIAGLAGGLASSTAVAITSARRSREDVNIDGIAAGALAASATSPLKAIAVISVLLPGRLPAIGPILGAAAVVFLAAALVVSLRRGASPNEPAAMGNPFRLLSVLQMTALLAATTLAVRIVSNLFGGSGTILASAIMGFVDIDAVILSSSRLAATGVAPMAIDLSIVLAVATNILAKSAYSFGLGSRAYALRIAAASALALVAGAGTALVTMG